MSKAYLLLGSNMGDSMEKLSIAKEAIGKRIGMVKQVSSIYKSEPWGFEAEQVFLNQVVVIDTSMGPENILQEIKHIEEQMGRKRSAVKGYESRKIDIDILFYDDITYQSEHLTIPHPLLQERRFTLLPLSELVPEFMHPGFKKPISELLK